MTLAIATGAGNVATAAAGSANNVTVGKPANTADGDVLVAAVYFRNSGGTITKPTGWSQLGPLNTTNETFALFCKGIPSAAAETATDYNFSTSAGSSRAAGIIARIPGVNLANVKDAEGALAGYTGTTNVVLPAVSAISGYTLLLAMAITNNAVTGAPSGVTPPAGMTEIGEVSADNGTTATATIWLGGQILSTAGSTSTRTPTISPAASNSGGVMVTLEGASVVAPEATVVPDQVVEATGWNANTGTILTALGDSSDATYVQSPTLTGSDTTLRVGFPALVESPGGVRVRLRAGLDVTTTTTTQVALYQGATLIKSWTIAPDSVADFDLVASAADVAGVTNWGALEVEITSHA